jgi:probable H4MPT-linked C1 transfer pathway protein
MSTTLGLDIGGANLKAADATGRAETTPFPLWKHPDRLAKALRDLLGRFSPAAALAVTMTGELCDCFPGKRQGVAHILAAVEQVAAGRPVHVWTNEGRFVDTARARELALQVAAANWLALATYAGRQVPTGSALLIDVGSTTTDVIPLWHGRPVPSGRTDPERLRSGELVYTGVRRTPLCAVLPGAAAEWFATTLDAHLVLGHLPEDADDRDTADGQPATVAAAEARLARMFCGDLETSTAPERRAVAERAARRQRALLRRAIDRVGRRLPERPRAVVLAGSGEFLARQALPRDAGVRVASLAQELGPDLSTAACAYAVAVLSRLRPDFFPSPLVGEGLGVRGIPTPEERDPPHPNPLPPGEREKEL